MSIGAWIVTGVLLVLNGFFVAVEFALVGSRRSKLEAMAADGHRSANAALAATRDLTLQLAGAQLGITIASLLLGFVAEPAAVDLIERATGPLSMPAGLHHAIALVVGLGIVVFLHLVLGEMVPKGIALANPERTLLRVAAPNGVYLTLFGPIIRFLNWSAAGFSRFVLRIEPRNALPTAHTAEEVAVMLAESKQEGLIEEFAHDLLTGVLDFGGRDAAAVMVERDQIVTVSRDDTVEDVERIVVERGHSRLPVVGPGGIDDVIGFIHAKDLLTVPADARHRPILFRLIRRMLVVPRDRSLEDLLVSMRQSRVHFALVVEPNRATAGLVTLEDLLEELVGDILDESDRR